MFTLPTSNDMRTFSKNDAHIDDDMISYRDQTVEEVSCSLIVLNQESVHVVDMKCADETNTHTIQMINDKQNCFQGSLDLDHFLLNSMC